MLRVRNSSDGRVIEYRCCNARENSSYSALTHILRIATICAGGTKAYKAVNVGLIDTYWAVGEYLSRTVAESGWGNGVVKELAD
jgi:hypothetical protein